ncbi:hypothetical protein [Sphingopyxis sp.]|uniref:hypothetical protein n=1 Tax=Sphingopyxis sp. TaxID=1908224 RepID=UPI002B48C9BB|nr:hypothetical protein [Sphingopyxis sp.]HJS10797.1 hypothetical protein [Sphingopyxis sp.]
MRKLTSLTTAAAIVLTSVGLSAVPAEARGRHHGGWGYRDRDHISTGEVLGGLFVIGAIAAIASSVGKDKRERAPDYRYEPPYRGDDQRQEVPRYEPDAQDDVTPGAYDRGEGAYGRGEGAYGRGEAEGRAADACSWAVEGEMGDDARVDSITGTEPNNGGWYVTGTASRLGGEVSSFGCSYRGGRVVDVNFG